MSRLFIVSTFLTSAVLGASGVAKNDVSADENTYFIKNLGNFFEEFEYAVANQEVSDVATCKSNALTYSSSYTSMDCSNVDCSSSQLRRLSATGAPITPCCNGMEAWASMEDGCKNWQGENSQKCCFECTDTNYVGLPYFCSSDPARLLGPAICDSSPLSPATAPLPAGVACSPAPVSVTGDFIDDNGVVQSSPNCDFLVSAIFDDSLSGQAFFDAITTNTDLQAMSAAGSFVFRPVLVQGKATFESTTHCNLLLSPHVNGEFSVNPSKIAFPGGGGPETILFNATVYAGCPAVHLNGGKFFLIDGENHGEVLVDTLDVVKVGKFRNYGRVEVRNSADFSVNVVSNGGALDIVASSSSVHDLHNRGSGIVTVDGGDVLATNITNEGSIVIKTGTRCILDLWANSGTIRFEDGAKCDVYLNDNAYSGQGTLLYDAVLSPQVVVMHGRYITPVRQPLVEAFGKWTTGAYRAGKSRWVGDESIEHGACDMFRFNTMGIRSVIQSPSNKTFNAIVEISHPKRQLRVDMSFINITLHDKNNNEWHFSRPLFEDSDVVTHLELPQHDGTGVVASSMNNFRLLVSLDFEELFIPASRKNTIEIGVYSLRQGRDRVKLDSADCVRLRDVGVAQVQVEALG